jgi:hypothetical protein
MAFHSGTRGLHRMRISRADQAGTRLRPPPSSQNQYATGQQINVPAARCLKEHLAIAALGGWSACHPMPTGFAGRSRARPQTIRTLAQQEARNQPSQGVASSVLGGFS